MRRRTLTIVLLSVAGCLVEEHTFTPIPDANLCGDGVKNDGESCDGDDLDGMDCASAGEFSGGELDCDENCALVTSACDSSPSTPRLRRPMNDQYVGTFGIDDSLRPTFEWTPSIPAGDLTVEYTLEYGLDAAFETDVVSVTMSSTSYRPPSAFDVSTIPPVGARYFWRVTACQGSQCSAPSKAQWINLARQRSDFNGDGYADALVGARGSDAGGANSGAALVFFGTPGASFDTTPDVTLTGPFLGGGFGESVASAGDLNGDGYADVVVGAPDVNVLAWPGAGSAYVYLGGPGASLDDAPAATLTGDALSAALGVSVGPAGDVDADGYSDLVVRSYEAVRIYRGGPGNVFDATADTTLPGNYFSSVGTIGDANGDGFADVVVGVHDSAERGHALVYFGSADAIGSTADRTLTDDEGAKSFGDAVATAGDINADGYADLVVGDEDTDVAFLYLGGADPSFEEADRVFRGSANEDFGAAMSGASDLNDDGFDDVIVGAPVAGRVYLFLGSPYALHEPRPSGRRAEPAECRPWSAISVCDGGSVVRAA